MGFFRLVLGPGYLVWMALFCGPYWLRHVIAALFFGLALFGVYAGQVAEADRQAYLAAPQPPAQDIDQVQPLPRAGLQLAHLRARIALDLTRPLPRSGNREGNMMLVLQDPDAPPESREVRAILSIPPDQKAAFKLWTLSHLEQASETGLIVTMDGEVRDLNNDPAAVKALKLMKLQPDAEAFRFVPYFEPRHAVLARMDTDLSLASWVFFKIGAGFAALGALQGLWRRKQPAAPAPIRKPRLVLSRRGQWTLAILSTLGVLGFVAQDLFAGKSLWMVALGLAGPASAAITYARRTADASEKALAPFAKAIAQEEARTFTPPDPRPVGGPIESTPSLLERFSPFLAHAKTAKYMPVLLVVGIGLLAPKIMGAGQPLANMADGVNPLDSLPLTAGAAGAFAVTLTAAWAVQRYLRLNARAKIITSDPWERIERERQR
ncbi:hypothetical protein NX862_19265 [Rhodobacter sp. KR11]|uniref:hypothetical protein n=1 Tax=Rhodobacter sp. KR11 TaxID=2974588 RepID=UPI00222141EC|nr:hypothetical protein [Rhodobacter sp. KR11]MCW1920902.1 hypothetical protein [Rhodobacter sp. KR11]